MAGRLPSGPQVLWVGTGTILTRPPLMRFETAWPSVEPLLANGHRLIELRSCPPITKTALLGSEAPSRAGSRRAVSGSGVRAAFRLSRHDPGELAQDRHGQHSAQSQGHQKRQGVGEGSGGGHGLGLSKKGQLGRGLGDDLAGLVQHRHRNRDIGEAGGDESGDPGGHGHRGLSRAWRLLLAAFR